MEEFVLNAAIIGCGKIADAHADLIQRIKGARIVGVYDREPLMARQLQDRFRIDAYYSDLAELLNKSKPDVVHITTPPQSHFGIAEFCLKAGCHVYVEKPFTLNERDGHALVALAEKRGLKITVGHDDQFRPAARRMRALVQKGFLGSGPVHMESYYCYELGNSRYAQALLGDRQHWVRKLPGKLLHNIISHGIARIAEFMKDDSPTVIASGSVSPVLKRMGENEIIDELRVIIREKQGVSAYFTFSSQMRPSLHQFRIYGDQNGLILDQDQETLIKVRGTRYKSYLEKFFPPVTFSKQYLGNLTTNVGAFLRKDFHMKGGMKFLIESFYQSIVEGTPLPISYREILLTAKIMDEIFSQLDSDGAYTRPLSISAPVTV